MRRVRPVARSKKPTKRAKPHARTKAAKRERAAKPMSLDEQWAAGICRDLRDSLHPKQRDAYDDPARRVSFLVGRGGGKTSALICRALRKMVTKKKALVAFVASSRPWAKRLIWLPLKNLIDRLHLTDEFEFLDGELTCTCKRTGSRYMLFGADDEKEVDKLRGVGYDEVQIDEAAALALELLEYLISEAVGPRMGERDGCIVLSGTPGHILRGRFHDVTRPGITNKDGSPKHRPYRERNNPDFAGWIGWSSHHWNMLDVVGLVGEDISEETRQELGVARDAVLEGRLDEAHAILRDANGISDFARARWPALVKNWEDALLEKKEQGWTDQNPKWKREYLAIWAANDTLNMYDYRARREGADASLLNRWEPTGETPLEGLALLEAAIAALKKLRPEITDWLFAYGIDLGWRDPFALTILAFSPSDPRRCFYHVYSFERRKMRPSTIAALLLGEEEAKRVAAGDYPDKYGGLFGRTGWPVAIVADLAGNGESVTDELAATYGVTIKPAEKKDKYSAIELVNGDLVDERMWIIGGSPLEKQLEDLQWKPDEYGVLKEDKAVPNHSADSLVYIRREIGSMFAGVTNQDDEASEGRREAHAAKPKREKAVRETKSPRLHDTWGEGPTSSVRRDPSGTPTGEYDSLICESHFGWGNE